MSTSAGSARGHEDILYGLSHRDEDDQAWVFLLFDTSDPGQPLYQELLEQRVEIENAMGTELEWHQPDPEGIAWVGLHTAVSEVDNRDGQLVATEWMEANLLSLRSVLNPRLN